MKKSIIPLPKEFIGTGEVKGFKYRRIKETVPTYLYEVDNFGIIHYEVIKRDISPLCIDFKSKLFSDT